MEYVKDICEIGEKAGELLKKINRGEEIKVSDAPAVKELMSIVQKSMDIERMDEERGGYSEGGEWSAEGIYGRGSSYANKGKHYVRGHYSRDDGSPYDGDRERYSRDSGYSQSVGRREKISFLEMMMKEASSDRERQAIRRCIEQIENG